MRNTLFVASVLLLTTAVPAHAVPITARAMGTITLNGSIPRPGIYQFTPGEAVFVEFEYDPERATLQGNSPTGATYYLEFTTFRVTTGGGYTSIGRRNFQPFSESVSVTNGPTDRVFFSLGGSDPNIDLTFTDPTGTALSSTALPTLAELLRFPGGTLGFSTFNVNISFLATVVPVADFPVPEPSTLALGLVGFGLAAASWMRRRGGTSRLA